MKKVISLLKRHLFRPKLAREAFVAYFHRLPDNIQVSWERDGKFIVGSVIAGENQFVTQGLNADEFIEMVNDSVITVFNIPEDYIDVINKSVTYFPPPEEYEKLNNKRISHSRFGFEKNKEVLRLA